MPAFVATDEAAVTAAKRAADTASDNRRAECGNGDPKQRGPNCRQREVDEKDAADRLAAATSAKVSTERAGTVEYLDMLDGVTIVEKVDEVTGLTSRVVVDYKQAAKGVDLEVRETYESALVFGRKTLEGLGLDPERAAEVEEFVRRRDLDRLALQQAEGISAGIDLLRAQMAQEPLSKPAREVEPLNPEAQEIVRRPPTAQNGQRG